MDEFPPRPAFDRDMAPPVDERMTPKEAAEFIGTTVATLRNWRHLGTGPAYFKPVKTIFYWRRDIDRWLLSRRVSHKR